MKAISGATCALILCVSAIASSQSETQHLDSQKPDVQAASAELAFARLKTLAGNYFPRESSVGQTPVRRTLLARQAFGYLDAVSPIAKTRSPIHKVLGHRLRLKWPS